MNLAIINSVYKSGSTGKLAFIQNEYFLSKGHDSKVYYGRKKSFYDGKSHYFGNSLVFYLSVAFTRVLDNQGPFTVLTTLKLLRVLSKRSIDAIVLHNSHGYYLNQNLLFKWALKNKIPIYWVLHDCWAFTGHCSYYLAVDCNKFKTHCSNCPQKESYPTSYGLDRSYINYRNKNNRYQTLTGLLNIISVSNWMANQVSHSILRNFPNHTIHNGINDVVIDYELAKKDKRHCLLAVSNIWETRKGLADILLLARHIDFSVYRIIVVGEVPKELNVKANKNIEFINRTDSFEKLCILYKQSLLLLNLTYEDNFPTVNIEALMNGTPVITYNTGGSPESINHQTGRVVDPGDILGVLEAIEEIRNIDYNIAKACRLRFLNNFTSLKMCSTLESLLVNQVQNG